MCWTPWSTSEASATRGPNIRVLPISSHFRNCDSSISIVPEYRLDDQAEAVSSSSLCVQTSSEAHPSTYTMGTGGPFLGGKARPGRETDHSPPSSAEFKNE
jgi:hypothetical protein